ncbi:hypothetical protein [Streptomyces sp. B6B3]|uniref:effector-associated constant component EACC1 n=1 Tax=Streptomyces sp. B6B3 TaxID=3153570 RepID=UPI00325E3C6B
MTLTVEGDTAEEELRSLHTWLLADPEARRGAQVELRASAPSRPDSMGGALDVISLVLGSGFSAASLAVTLAQWRGTRRHEGTTVIVERADGLKVTVSGTSTEEAQRTLRALGVLPDNRSEP